MATSYLGPILDGYVVNQYPPIVQFTPKEISVRHEVSRGNPRYHITGYLFQFRLSWEISLLTHAAWERLRIAANKQQSINFRPFPDRYYATIYQVRFVNALDNLDLFNHLTGYKGYIDLETVSVQSTIPAWA